MRFCVGPARPLMLAARETPDNIRSDAVTVGRDVMRLHRGGIKRRFATRSERRSFSGEGLAHRGVLADERSIGALGPRDLPFRAGTVTYALPRSCSDR